MTISGAGTHPVPDPADKDINNTRSYVEYAQHKDDNPRYFFTISYIEDNQGSLPLLH